MDEVGFGLVLSPYALRLLTPKLPLRITARGFTNPERGRGDCASKRRERVEGWATEPTDAMAQAVAFQHSATDVTMRGRDQAPSDDRREERCVNPLLYALAVHMSHLPRTANETVFAFRFIAVPAPLSINTTVPSSAHHQLSDQTSL